MEAEKTAVVKRALVAEECWWSEKAVGESVGGRKERWWPEKTVWW